MRFRLKKAYAHRCYGLFVAVSLALWSLHGVFVSWLVEDSDCPMHPFHSRGYALRRWMMARASVTALSLFTVGLNDLRRTAKTIEIP